MAEEEKAREEAEVRMLEDDVADKESLLLEELCKVRDGVGPPWSKFSGIEKAAEEGKQEGKKRRRMKLPKTSSSLLRPLPRTVRTWKSGHLPCGSSWCSVSGCCLTRDCFDVSVFYAQLGPILDARTCVSLRIMGDGPLYLAVACSTLSLPEEYSFAVFLGDDFRIRRILRFCV